MKPQTGWASVALVACMLLTVAWSIEAAHWTPGLGLLAPVVLGAVAVGTVLAGLRWMPATLAHLWSLVIGQLVTIFLASFQIESFASLAAADPAKLASLSLVGRISLVRDVLLDWLYIAWTYPVGQRPEMWQLPNIGTIKAAEMNQIFFVVVMGLLLWMLAYISTWFIIRYLSWWGAVLPSGFALVFNLYTARLEQPPLSHLAFFLLGALLLATQTHIALQEERWRRERIGFSPDLAFEFLRDGLIVAVAVIGMGWLLPTNIKQLQLRNLASKMSGASHNLDQQFNRLFPNLNYPVRGGGSEFASDMPLGGAIALGSKAIFDARVEGAPGPPRYWRMTAFDTYDGQTWKRTANGTSEVAEGEELGRPYAMTVPVTQTIRTMQSETQQLFAQPQPQKVSVGVRAESGAGAGEGRTDLLTLTSITPLKVGETFTVTSDVSVADVRSLREADTNDPDAVRARYLQLPPNVPQRVTDLARTLTADQATRFDKASAIESYLHTYRYEEQIDNPPAKRDRVDWFLFEERQGYCDYFSASFVVLARSVGIPARVAAGYSTGKPPADDPDVYRQHESDAHTWPEVYFPEYGWIQFEPTAADDPIARAQTPGDAAAMANVQRLRKDDQSDILKQEMEDQAKAKEAGQNLPQDTPPNPAAAASMPFQVPVWPLVGLLVLAAVVAGAFRLTWERPFQGLTAAEGAFARLVRVASWMGWRPRPTDTPNEYSQRLAGAIPEGSGEISTIVDAYVKERFGGRPSHTRMDSLRQAWSSLRRPLARAAARVGLRRLRPESTRPKR